MATDWLGSIVSINCGESLGVYQGRVSAVDQVSQTISLTRPFHNGVKCLVPEVTFRLVPVFFPPVFVFFFSRQGLWWFGCFVLFFPRNGLFALNLPTATERLWMRSASCVSVSLSAGDYFLALPSPC